MAMNFNIYQVSCIKMFKYINIEIKILHNGTTLCGEKETTVFIFLDFN